jgi:poly(3-hydroxybutyrate) depolymerase
MLSSSRVRTSLAWLVATTAAACGDSDPQAPAYSLGVCPELVEGVQSFASGELTYEVTIRLPEEPAGAPLAFVFHGLNGTSEQIGTRLEIDRLVAAGAIAVLPQSGSGADFEWQFLLQPDPEVNPDLRLFYDLLGCARQQFDIDMDRVWTTGMSAGGLWSSYLVLHASEWITAAAPFSGGVIGQVPYPARLVPVMLTWGGPEDQYSGFDFDAASEDFVFYLEDFGNPLIQCVNDLGHTVPPEAGVMLERFLRDQRWGDPDPFAGGLPAEFPSWCSQL